MYLKAAIDDRGKPIAWVQRSVFPPIASTFDASVRYGSEVEMGMGWVDVPFDIPNLRAENGPAQNHVRIGWLRSVANIYHAFAIQSFIDELATAAGRDQIEFFMDVLGRPRQIDFAAEGTQYWNNAKPLDQYPLDTSHLRRVVEVVAERSGWANKKPGKGRALGFAAHRSFLSYVAATTPWRGSTRRPTRRMFTAYRAMICQPGWASREFRQRCRRFIMRCSPRPVNAFASCRLTKRSLSDPDVARPMREEVCQGGRNAKLEGKVQRETRQWLSSSYGHATAEISVETLTRLAVSALTMALLAVWVSFGSEAAVTTATAAAPGAAESTFKARCAVCHGQDARGNAPIGKSSGIPDLRSTEVQRESDAQLAEIIANGTSKMPPFKNSLRSDQIDALVVYIRELAPQQ
jgi:mono/diheme cytochrome c family protein